MLRRPLLATTTAGATALALTLLAPTAALAAPGGADAEGRPGQPGASPQTPPGQQQRAEAPPQDRSRPAPAGEAKGRPAASGSAGAASSSSGAPASKGDASAKGKANANGKGKGKAAPAPEGRSASKGSGQGQAPSGGRPTADPAGNNGTIKISALPTDDGRGNEPHPGCAFALEHYGFDAGQTADITFTSHAPTGSGEVLLQQSGVTISTTPAGGGQDRDAVLTYTAADLGLTGDAPHRQGWHVKVAVDALQAPGGAKQKVFWLDCAGTAAQAPDGEQPPADQDAEQDDAGQGDVDGATGSTDTGTGTGTEGPSQDAVEATRVLSGSMTRPLAVTLISGTAGRDAVVAQTGVLGAVTARTQPSGAVVAASSATAASVRPAVLPFTGTESLPALVALSAAALAAGGALLAAGRRRSA